MSWTGLLSHTGLLFIRWSLTLPSADWTRENCFLSENKKVRIECTYHVLIFYFLFFQCYSAFWQNTERCCLKSYIFLAFKSFKIVMSASFVSWVLSSCLLKFFDIYSNTLAILCCITWCNMYSESNCGIITVHTN